MKKKIKTALKILSFVAVAAWVMPLTSQAAIISADGQLPTFYVFADGDMETPATQSIPMQTWKFEPVLETGSPVVVRVLTPELEIEQVKTPGVTMELTRQESARK